MQSATMRNTKVKALSSEYSCLEPEIRSIVDRYVSDYPVKLGALANHLGVKVLLSTLPRGISGQISQEHGKFVIRINRHEARHRQRFTLAHELAHYLLHEELIKKSGRWSENILLRSGQPMNIEYEANRLVSDLVIPPQQLANVLEAYPEPITSEAITDLAKRFGVSTATMELKLQMI